jgi:hypothetical protein
MRGDPRARLARIGLPAAIAIALGVPASASATVTIGSNLGREPNIDLDCGTPCTVMQGPLGSEFQAPNGIVSPVNGTVVQWRIRSGTHVGQVTFRVIRPLLNNVFTGAGTSATVAPPPNATTGFPTQLPIAIGDKIGIDCCPTPGHNYFVMNPSGVRQEFLNTPLADGDPGRTPVVTNGREVAINADIEPTSAFAVTGLQRSKHGKLLITATLPNAGILRAGDKKAAFAAAAAKKKKKKPQLLKQTQVQVGGPTGTQLLVFPTKAALRALNEGKKVKAGLKLSFTPTGGTASTQLIKLRLRP